MRLLAALSSRWRQRLATMNALSRRLRTWTSVNTSSSMRAAKRRNLCIVALTWGWVFAFSSRLGYMVVRRPDGEYNERISSLGCVLLVCIVHIWENDVSEQDCNHAPILHYAAISNIPYRSKVHNCKSCSQHSVLKLRWRYRLMIASLMSS